MSDTPIDPQPYLAGLKIVDIGDIRVARGKSRRPYQSCKHLQLIVDKEERRVWCQDCETNVDSFDAFLSVVMQWSNAAHKFEQRRMAVERLEQETVVSRAAKVFDKEFRKQKSVPLCPHCSAAILPDDVVKGLASTSKELVLARRNRDKVAK